MSKIKMGMVGGGAGAMIGGIHRMAARLDGEVDLVCGAFSSTPEKAKASAAKLGVAPERAYGSYQEMMAAEAALPVADRMDFVSIVTPNHMHAPVALAALAAGFHVLSDKPATRTVAEAQTIAAKVAETGLLYGLTHNYSAYPLISTARDKIADGALGTIRKICVDYLQGWLSEPAAPDNKQAAWRADPTLAGPAGAMGDIGSHAAQLAEAMTGHRLRRVSGHLSTIVDGRVLDDDAVVLFETDRQAKGILNVSQIATGEENGLSIRVYGTKGGLEWHQQDPNTLTLKWLDNSRTILRTGNDHAGVIAQSQSRVPSGHPEAFLEAFGNLYRNFAAKIRAVQAGEAAPATAIVPDIHDAVHGMAVIEAVVASSQHDHAWTEVKA